MKAKLLAMAVVLAFSGAAIAGEMSGGSSNPAEKGTPTTPKQPNETQPGQASAAGDKDTKGMKKDKGMKEGMKGDKMGKSDKMGMKGESMNAGNPAEKGSKTPSQPNETQPGTGSVKK
jgi:hypothetical protein